MIIIPEVKIYNILFTLIKAIRIDFQNKPEKESLLYKFFNDASLEKHDYYKIAKDIFLSKKGEKQRYLDIKIFFDRSRAEMPTIHISQPGEQPANDSIGMGEGDYNVETFDENTISPSFNKRFNATYNIIFTSSNPIETIVMYHTMKAMLLSYYELLYANGLEKPSFGGQDLLLNESLVPNHIHIKSLSLTLDYELTVPSALNLQQIFNSANFNSSIEEN